MTMLRSSSPAMSEISVGSPSPPPLLGASAHTNAANVLDIKRLRNSVEILPTRSLEFPVPLAISERRKSSAERVKSFSIADILGKKEQEIKAPMPEKSRCETQAQQTLLPPSAVLAGITANPGISHHHLAERLPPSPSLPASAPFLMLDLPTLHKVMPTSWEPVSATSSSPPSLPLHHFFPPALLHYEQRLAWDYQRQLQEHFQAQAQLLRQMSMDPNIIPSEDGSERSRSSSAGSHCYSPEVNVAGDDDIGEAEGEDSAGKCDRLISNKGNSLKNVNEDSKRSVNDTPLDALFQLSTKNFDEDQDPATLNIFATRPNPKKKRKSRTAFTNHQIFELEKRFLYQKYLSPADRDEIAAGLGLSNAQVITWFQNRRAKLKRDMEELKKDVESVKQLSAHKSFLENVNDLSILKTRPVSRHQYLPPTVPQQQQQQLQQHHLAEVHTPAHTHGNHTTGIFNAASTEGLSHLPAATTGNIKSTVQHHQLQFNITAPKATNTCNERRNTGGSNSSGGNEDSLQQTQQHNAQQEQQQPQQPRNLQINHSRG